MRSLPRILIVEDESAIAELISVNLRHNGFQPVWAMDAESAQRELDEVLPDVILLDWMLPGESGLTLARRWRAATRTKAVPILMLTARSEDSDRVEGLENGADDYLTKPFSAEELQLRVKALLKRVKLQVDSPEQKILQIGTYIFDTENFTLKSPSQLITLTKKEAMILRTLNKFKNQLIPRDVILNSVWGQDDYFVGRSLDVFITKLRKYLKEDPKVSIANIHGIGFKLELAD